MASLGSGAPNAELYLLVVVVAVVLADRFSPRTAERPTRRDIVAAGSLWLLVAIPSLLQWVFPPLLTALQRDPELIRVHGQLWRVLTSLVVQDGGLLGTVFNLALLAVVAVVAVRAWGPAPAATLFLAVHLVFNAVTTWVFPAVGAGNSGATLGLAASLAGAALARPHRRAVVALGAGTTAAGVLLLVLRDGHGFAVLAGELLGAAAVLVRHRRAVPRP